MTPKEKANEILDKYWLVDNIIPMFTVKQAKQCALIAVDEILNSRRKHLVQSLKFYEYWQEVKQEIEKL